MWAASLQAALLTPESLAEVNAPLYRYIAQSKFTPLARTLFYAYLARAQNDFAWQSHQKNGQFVGTFVPVSLGILKFFDPEAEIAEFEEQTADPVSDVLAMTILKEAAVRFNKDQAGIHDYPIKQGKGLWQPNDGYYGLNYASILPWHLKTMRDCRCPQPNMSPEHLLKESEAVIFAMQKLDKANLLAIDYWANRADWVKIAEKYMRNHHTPIELTLQVRDVLFTALSDSQGAAFDSKYTYWVPRPSQVNPQIIPVIPLPSHPSYPSAHSAVGKTAAVILSHYFPADKAEWDRMAEEAGLSRILAGIHFPLDHVKGKEQGEQIGKIALSRK